MSKASFYGIPAKTRKQFAPRRREGRAAEPMPLPSEEEKQGRKRPLWLRREALAKLRAGKGA